MTGSSAGGYGGGEDGGGNNATAAATRNHRQREQAPLDRRQLQREEIQQQRQNYQHQQQHQPPPPPPQQQNQQQRQLEHFQQQQLFAGSGSRADSGASVSEDYKLVWRRRQSENPSTEGSLRALLNKLAPSRVLGRLATQVADHLVDDDAPDHLARQLVERAQAECLFAPTYAKLCSNLVRARSGFVFYKHLMTRCRSTFSSKVRLLIVEATELEEPSSSAVAVSANQTQLSKNSSALDVDRHRLNALVIFLCHLFLEELLSFDQLHQDYLRQLDCQLPDRIALECLCSALKVAGRRLEEQRPHWVLDIIRQAQDAVNGLQQERNLRLTFMVRDLVELHQRNWQQREPQIPNPPIEHAEP